MGGWLTAPIEVAKELQRSLPDDVLSVVEEGKRRDGGWLEI